jgi:hypothetical protein
VTRKPGSISVWRQHAGDEVRAMVVPGHLGVKAQVAIDPGARWVATGGREGARLWSIEGSVITRLTTDDTIGVEFLTDPPRILTLHDDSLRLWRIVESGGGVGGCGAWAVCASSRRASCGPSRWTVAWR